MAVMEITPRHQSLPTCASLHLPQKSNHQRVSLGSPMAYSLLPLWRNHWLLQTDLLMHPVHQPVLRGKHNPCIPVLVLKLKPSHQPLTAISCLTQLTLASSPPPGTLLASFGKCVRA